MKSSFFVQLNGKKSQKSHTQMPRYLKGTVQHPLSCLDLDGKMDTALVVNFIWRYNQGGLAWLSIKTRHSNSSLALTKGYKNHLWSLLIGILNLLFFIQKRKKWCQNNKLWLNDSGTIFTFGQSQACHFPSIPVLVMSKLCSDCSFTFRNDSDINLFIQHSVRKWKSNTELFKSKHEITKSSMGFIEVYWLTIQNLPELVLPTNSYSWVEC